MAALLPADEADPLGPALEWAVAHLREPLTVDKPARRARMSARTFHRHFTRAVGVSPTAYRARFPGAALTPSGPPSTGR
ncbi:AraC family transcriptional regulator [Streptomyces sp. NPDC051909]|uniref:AraC family transcriptional regulator n=1 Tax=Streptomyces sp. NPDC051909 TaxID=3154944 RepID=UPI0034431C57